MPASRWNLNTHYHPLVLAAVPPVGATAERLLPGVQLRRHVLFRYSLLWTKRGRG